MHRNIKVMLGAVGLAMATHAAAQVTLYEDEGFHGRRFSTDRPVWNFDRSDFNDRASSLVVNGGRWEVCEDARFEGRCVTVGPGEYPSLRRMGLNDRISSVRPVNDRVGAYDQPRYAVSDEYRARPNERLFDVPVVSVRAVVGPPEQRCWVERQEVQGGNVNVPGAIVGGIIGGVLGHQIGSGRGRDVATGLGAVGGAAVGANVGGGGGGYTQDVQRCASGPSGQVDYYDVTYDWHGTPHHVQMTSPPGQTIRVNGNGEPRM
ncbi:MAG TPA: beta/gamma crystallin-related protein [Casimicrobiaceae bacterium]|nr:beta/gamma crystallin-related protein [Casimicrobiaceae bacterium]